MSSSTSSGFSESFADVDADGTGRFRAMRARSGRADHKKHAPRMLRQNTPHACSDKTRPMHAHTKHAPRMLRQNTPRHRTLRKKTPTHAQTKHAPRMLRQNTPHACSDKTRPTHAAMGAEAVVSRAVVLRASVRPRSGGGGPLALQATAATLVSSRERCKAAERGNNADASGKRRRHKKKTKKQAARGTAHHQTTLLVVVLVWLCCLVWERVRAERSAAQRSDDDDGDDAPMLSQIVTSMENGQGVPLPNLCLIT